MRVVSVLLLSLPLLSGGCAAVILIPRAIEQMTEVTDAPAGFEFHRSDGAMEDGRPFRIRHFLDLTARRWYVVATIDGRTFSSRRDDIAGAMDEARAAYPGIEGTSDDDVTRRFGTPYKQSRFEDIRVLWYLRERERGDDDVYALVFRQGRFVAAFRTSRTDAERMLDKPSPYATGRLDYGPSTPWTKRALTTVR